MTAGSIRGAVHDQALPYQFCTGDRRKPVRNASYPGEAMTWLDGQVVLVTGGGSGLGRAIVERFVREGASVAVLDRSAEKLAALRDQLGSRIIAIAGDVTKLEDNQRAVAETVQAFGRLDCFVGNAGLHDASTPLATMSAESLSSAFDELMGVNVKGYLLGAKASLSELLRTDGRIIFTVSNAAFDPGGGGVLYTSSKWAVRGLITQLAYELAPRVRVNGVAPGPLASDLRGPEALGLQDTAIAVGERLAKVGVEAFLIAAGTTAPKSDGMELRRRVLRHKVEASPLEAFMHRRQ